MAGCLVVLSPAARAEDDEAPTGGHGRVWNLTLGGGVGVIPHYEGADRSRIEPLPFFSASYRDIVSLGIEGLGVTVFRADGFSVTPTIGYDRGRKESTDSNLKGLGTIQAALTAGVVLKYETGPFSFALAPRESVIQNRDGFEATVSGTYAWRPTARLRVSFGPELTLADNRRERTYFGVDALQSARSGKRLYNPSGGVESVGAATTVSYALDDHWQLMTRLADDVLVGDAADSPIVRSKNQATVMTGVTYHF
ncbi:MipA/OmpV family protein [Aliidongia dinghuensis]|nr:MipA/OmpV family protein [Aliidongia dinghuensis]